MRKEGEKEGLERLGLGLVKSYSLEEEEQKEEKRSSSGA